MGYFRDDQPLYELILDDEGADASSTRCGRSSTSSPRRRRRTYVQFYPQRKRRGAQGRRGASRRARVPTDKDITSDADDPEGRRELPRPMRVQPSNADGHQGDRGALRMRSTRRIRWVEKARLDAEPTHLDGAAGLRRARLSAAADRRPSATDLLAFYRSLRDKARPRARGRDARRARQRADVAGFLLPHRSRLPSARRGAGRARRCRTTRWPAAELLPLVEHARRRAAGARRRRRSAPARGARRRRRGGC